MSMLHTLEELSALLFVNINRSVNVSAGLFPHHLLVLRNVSISRVLNPVGLVAVASLCSVIFGLIPFFRRGWKRSPISRKEESAETTPDNVSADESNRATRLAVSPCESFEEVTLSFGTDRPEVYMKMCKQDSPCSVIQTAALRQLVVH